MRYELTKKEILEELVKCGKDPKYFINNFAKISHPMRGLIPFRLYDFQSDIIDDFNKDLKPLKSFVLPGGHELCTRLHVSRAVCRRVERVVAQLKNKEEIDLIILVYLNRLSDFLFVASRWVNDLFDIKEVTWDPNYKKMGKDKVSHK